MCVKFVFGGKVDAKMECGFTEIKTFNQAKFHLIAGRVLCCNLDDGLAYITYKSGSFKMIVQPHVGSGKEYRGTLNQLEDTMLAMFGRVKVYALNEGKLVSQKNSVLDRFADFIRSENED